VRGDQNIKAETKAIVAYRREKWARHVMPEYTRFLPEVKREVAGTPDDIPSFASKKGCCRVRAHASAPTCVAQNILSGRVNRPGESDVQALPGSALCVS